MQVYVDTCSAADFDKVVRYLYDRDVDVTNRDKTKLVVCVDISEELIDELKEMDLDNTISIGTKPLIP